MDNRVQARVLGSKVLALMLGANSIPPLGGSIGVADIRSAAEADVTRILSTQQADGSYRFAVQCGYSSNFMTGLLNGVLGQYYTHVSPDPRIQGAVQKSYDYLFASQWLPSKKLFQYYSGVCSDSNTDPGGDLNGLFLDGLGWLYSQTHAGDLLAKGDQVFEGGVLNTWLTGGKMFNQQYQMSWRWLGYRTGMSTDAH